MTEEERLLYQELYSSAKEAFRTMLAAKNPFASK